MVCVVLSGLTVVIAPAVFSGTAYVTRGDGVKLSGDTM